MRFIASIRSRPSLWRVLNTVPWFSISSWFQPLPTPNRNRPLDTRSSEDTNLAVTIGSRCGQTDAGADFQVGRHRGGGIQRDERIVDLEIGRIKGPPDGGGVFRVSGICVCSGTQSDSNPRCSSSIAQIGGLHDSVVKNMTAPIFMRWLLGVIVPHRCRIEANTAQFPRRPRPGP